MPVERSGQTRDIFRQYRLCDTDGDKRLSHSVALCQLYTVLPQWFMLLTSSYVTSESLEDCVNQRLAANNTDIQQATMTYSVRRNKLPACHWPDETQHREQKGTAMYCYTYTTQIVDTVCKPFCNVATEQLILKQPRVTSRQHYLFWTGLSARSRYSCSRREYVVINVGQQEGPSSLFMTSRPSCRILTTSLIHRVFRSDS